MKPMLSLSLRILLITLAGAGLSWGQFIAPYVISTVAGVYSLGDGGPAASAMLELPESVAVDKDGTIYIGEAAIGRIRKITPSGVISTLEEVSALDLKPDGKGNLYGVDGNNAAFVIGTDGVARLVAGAGTGFGGDGGPAVSALLNHPSGIALDAAGNIYIADSWNHRIRKITPDGVILRIR